MLIHVLYHSRAVEPMDVGPLHSLAAESETRNREKGITGVLLYNAGYFVQLLEGEYDEVVPLSRKIEQDERHTHFTYLLVGGTYNRIFPDWSMHLINLNGELDFDAQALRDIITSADPIALGPHNSRGARIVNALRTFRKQNPASDIGAYVAGSTRAKA